MLDHVVEAKGEDKLVTLVLGGDVDKRELVLFVDLARVDTNVPPVDLVEKCVRAVQLLQ